MNLKFIQNLVIIVNLISLQALVVMASLGMPTPDVDAKSAVLGKVQMLLADEKTADDMLIFGNKFLTDPRNIGANIDGCQVHPVLVRPIRLSTYAHPAVHQKKLHTHKPIRS